MTFPRLQEHRGPHQIEHGEEELQRDAVPAEECGERADECGRDEAHGVHAQEREVHSHCLPEVGTDLHCQIYANIIIPFFTSVKYFQLKINFAIYFFKSVVLSDDGFDSLLDSDEKEIMAYLTKNFLTYFDHLTG